MTKSSCCPDPSEPWEWRLPCRGDGQGGESGGWTWTQTAEKVSALKWTSTVLVVQDKTFGSIIFIHNNTEVTIGSFSSESRPRGANAANGRSRLAAVIYIDTHRAGFSVVGETLKSCVKSSLRWRTCVLGLLTKAPTFLVNALSDSTGSEGETLLRPSSLRPSPLCDKPSSSPLRGERGTRQEV